MPQRHKNKQPTEKEDTAKRLTQNEKKRKWYASLPEERKEAIRAKKRLSYWHKKHDRDEDNKKEAPSRQPKRRKTTTLQKGETSKTHNSSAVEPQNQQCNPQMYKPRRAIGIVIRDEEWPEQNLVQSRGKQKEQSSVFSSFEIGSSSTRPNNTPLSQTHFKNLFDFRVFSRLPNVHIKSNVCNTVEDLAIQKRNACITDQGTQPIQRRFAHPLDNISAQADVLPSRDPCKYCAAKLFYHEPPGFCCSGGEVLLTPTNVPDDLYNLYTSNSSTSRHFRTYIRTYNSSFAFTSFGVTYDKELCKRNKGIYTFRAQGQAYHYINDISNTASPNYLQLYFYDTEHEVENRMDKQNKLDRHILQRIIEIMKMNPYAIFFRRLSAIPNSEWQRIIIRSDADLDQRVYNSPSASQVAAIWTENDNNNEYRERDIIVYNHSGFSHRVQYYYGCYDPLQYPLLFPLGDTGWHQGIKRTDNRNTESCKGQSSVDPKEMASASELLNTEQKLLDKGKNKRANVSCREYYCHKLQIRPKERSLLLRSGRLLQQFVVDMYIKLETSRLEYFRNKQKEIRADLYQGAVDSVALGETRGSKVGCPIILPRSFIGGPRDMRSRYMDAMALIQKYGKPDIFLTMTCNPAWQEIKAELSAGEESHNRPDLTTRIYKAKLEQLKKEIIEKQVLGPIEAYTYVVEFQKRGLPHVHFLLVFKPHAKLISPDSYDRIVSAELPDKEKYPHLYATVIRHMMHGPCGIPNRKNVCEKPDGSCRSQYPKSFCETTTHGRNSYPRYKRRNDGQTVHVRGIDLDNRWVVPYNPYLLAKFDCHMNVEVCSTIKAIKYLYKYIYKGHDRVAFQISASDESNVIDEIKQFQSARWISPPEAIWRIYRFPLNEMHPSVQSLQLHLQDHQNISFNKYTDLSNLLKCDHYNKTMLTEYFLTNKQRPTEQKYLYKEFPEHFVWNNQLKRWTPRQKKTAIGRIVTANPTEGERYYLRLLLNHIRGPTSYDDLKTINGKQVQTFREAALLHGLLEADNNLELCLEEATQYQMPHALRRLFATILVYCQPSDPKGLWDKFEVAMSEDYQKIHSLTNKQIRIKVLQNINTMLESMGKKIKDYGLVTCDLNLNNVEIISKEIEEEMLIITSEEDLNSRLTLNTEQYRAYATIIDKVLSNQPGAFFVDGPAGSGKSYLYRSILATIRSKSLIALATATSGVAASILPGGRTAHSRFKIPINIEENSTCKVSKQSDLAKLLKATRLIIWDEASMARRENIEAFSEMLKDINDSQLPFGGKVVVFGGDFRQVLPVVPKTTRQQSIDASLVKSKLWPTLEKIKLTTNMRANSDVQFTNFLLEIGNGTKQTTPTNEITIPPNMLIPYRNDTDSINDLIQFVYSNLHLYAQKPELMTDCAILTPKNDYVDHINNLLIETFPGDVTEYKSYDKTIDTNQQGQYEDFLHSLTPNGLPPHILRLKVNCPIILLRNIDPREGLCNGTRLICRRFDRNVIDAEIAVGHDRGKRVFLPRIPLQPSDTDKYPISFERAQFPIRLCFAMTINKSQGQTLNKVGVYLPQPVFSHGQLYVALSRAKTSNSIRVLIKPTSNDDYNDKTTKNTVYHDFLASVENSNS